MFPAVAIAPPTFTAQFHKTPVKEPLPRFDQKVRSSHTKRQAITSNQQASNNQSTLHIMSTQQSARDVAANVKGAVDEVSCGINLV
jgi:hypothetical protein